MKDYLHRLSTTLFHDASPKDFLPFYYKVMNYQEGPYEQLSTSGLTTDYLTRETKRVLAARGGTRRI
jgi:hypothetical protein